MGRSFRIVARLFRLVTWGSASRTSIASWVVKAKPQRGSATKASTSLAALAEPQALLAGDQPPQRRDRRRFAVRAREGHASERVRVPGDEPAPEERAEGMAEEDDRRPRLLGGDQSVERPEVANDLVPAALIGEVAEIGGGRLWPVTAMVVGVGRVARGIERSGETCVAGAVLGEAMGDLHDRTRRTFWQPTPRQQGLAIVGAKVEFAPRHLPPLIVAVPWRAGTHWNLACIRERRQAGGIEGDSPRRIDPDRLG